MANSSDGNNENGSLRFEQVEILPLSAGSLMLTQARVAVLRHEILQRRGFRLKSSVSRSMFSSSKRSSQR